MSLNNRTLKAFKMLLNNSLKKTEQVFYRMVKYSKILGRRMANSNAFKVTAIIAILFASLSWGVTSAVNNDITTATSNFSVMGKIIATTDSQISITDAKSSNLSGDGAYYLDIQFVRDVQTTSYSTLTINDIGVGDVIIAQGLTNGHTFFVKRIIRVSEGDGFLKDLLKKDEADKEGGANSTSTESTAVSSSTDSVVGNENGGAGSTTTNSISGGSDNTKPNTSTTSDINSTSTDNTASSTGETVASSTENTNATTSEGINNESAASTSNATTTDGNGVISGVIDAVVNVVTDVVNTIVDTVTGSGNETQPIPENNTDSTPIVNPSTE